MKSTAKMTFEKLFRMINNELEVAKFDLEKQSFHNFQFKSFYILNNYFSVECNRSHGEDPEEHEDGFDKLRKSIYLGICYSANIGGTGTLTGTGTNLILYGMAAYVYCSIFL